MEQNPSKPYQEVRPWGNFVEFVKNQPCTVKIITVEKGQAFSLQYHDDRDEFWRIISGNGVATVGGARKDIVVGEDYFVPRKSLHRIEAGSEDVVLLEIAYGNFNENDIVRVEDKYNRPSQIK
jgi:mannose-6-phosphate isomerase-like protein (cupin superfamily)